MKVCRDTRLARHSHGRGGESVATAIDESGNPKIWLELLVVATVSQQFTNRPASWQEQDAEIKIAN